MGERLEHLPADRFAADLRGFGPVGIFAMLLILAGNLLFVPFSAILVLAWAYGSRTPWRAIGFARPRSLLISAIVGVVLGSAFKLLMKMIVMPLLGAPPVNQTYHYLAGNTAAIPAVLYFILVGAAFGEETVFRGYMFERLGKLFGNRPGSTVLIVALTAILFGIDHYAIQGLPGVQQALIVGMVFGGIYAATRRLWMLMWAHAAFDLTAFAMIYWEREAYFAQLIFR